MRVVHGDRVLNLGFVDSTLLLSGCRDGTVRLWDTVAGKEKARPIAGPALNFVALSRDGRTLVGLDKMAAVIFVWDPQTGKEIAQLPQAGSMSWLAPSPDGTSVAFSNTIEGTVIVQEIRNGVKSPALRGHTRNLRELAWSTDGALLASESADHTVRLWDLKERACTAVIPVKGERASVTFSPDNGHLFVGDVGQILIWDVAARDSIGRLSPADRGELQARFSSLSFSPDGRLLVSAGGEGSVRVWEIASGKVLMKYLNPEKNALRTAFAPDGSRFAAGTAQGDLWVWTLPLTLKSTPATTADELWDRLASDDPSVAYASIVALDRGTPEMAESLRKRLTAPVEEAAVKAAIAKLDAEDVGERDRAERELEAMTHDPEVWKLLDQSTSESVRSRREAIAKRQRIPVAATPQTLRECRAVWVLERARAAAELEALAAGPARARLTQEAAQALKRIR